VINEGGRLMSAVAAMPGVEIRLGPIGSGSGDKLQV
jgi:hypothetical protein